MNFPHRLVCTVLSAVVFVALAASASSVRAADVAGSWSGYWTSDAKGHSGPMTAYITKIDDEHYAAHFRGRFWKIVPFRYSVVLTGKPEGDRVKLTGQSQLGRLVGGTYYYDGYVEGDQFKVGYTSCKHYGTFCMTRCAPPPPSCCAE